MSSTPPEFEARQLSIPKPLHTPSPHTSSFLYDTVSASLALRHSDSSFSLYTPFSPLSLPLPSFPPPKSLVPSPTSSATFLHLRTSTHNPPTTIFVTSFPLLRPSPATLLRFFVLRDDRFVKIRVVSNHRDLEFDRAKSGVVFKVNHGVSVKLSGGINVFSLYSVSNSKIWVFALRLIGDDGGGEALKLMKCAVIDCCLPVFSIRVLFGFLILGEENGVRVFPLQPLVKGNHRKEKKSSGKRYNLKNGFSNGVDAAKGNGDLNPLPAKGEKSEKHSDSVKLRSMILRQDSRDQGAFFMAFEDKDDKSSISMNIPGRSVKAISIQALSANYFVVLDSVGDVHLLCLSYSVQGFDKPCLMKRLSQTMKVLKLAVFHDVSTVTQTIWMSDGSHTVHLMTVSNMDTSFDKTDKKDTKEKLIQTSVTRAIFTSEKIQDIAPLSANAILILGQGHILFWNWINLLALKLVHARNFCWRIFHCRHLIILSVKEHCALDSSKCMITLVGHLTLGTRVQDVSMMFDLIFGRLLGSYSARFDTIQDSLQNFEGQDRMAVSESESGSSQRSSPTVQQAVSIAWAGSRIVMWN